MTVRPAGDPERVVRDVLGGAAYRSAPHESTKLPPPTFLAWLWDGFVHNVLRPIFGPLAHAFSVASGSGVGRILVFIVVAIALGLVVFVAYRLALAFARAAAPARVVAPGGVPLATDRDAAAWRTLARELASRGDFAGAIAALFAAALVLLDEAGIVMFDAARTPGEYRRAVRRARAALADGFDGLAERFVYATYAPEVPTANAYAEADAAFERFAPALSA